MQKKAFQMHHQHINQKEHSLPVSAFTSSLDNTGAFKIFLLPLLFTLWQRKIENITTQKETIFILTIHFILWMCIIMKISSFHHFTHQDLLRLLSPCQTRPTTPQLFLEPFSFFCVSFLVTLSARRWPQNWVITTIYNLYIFSFDLCLPRYKDETAAIFTTLSFSSPSCLSSSSPTTSMISVGLLLSLWFWPCNWDLDRMTPCDNIYQKPSETYPPNLPLVTVPANTAEMRSFS